jgi:hypothetical protein
MWYGEKISIKLKENKIMAVLTNFEEDELVVNCSCGCDEGVHIKLDHDTETDDYVFMVFTNGNFYKEQGHTFSTKLRKIWAVIRNKDFYYADICMSKEDFRRFKEWVNKVA